MFHRPESVDYLLAQICRLHHSRAHTLLEEIGLYRGQTHVLRVLWEREGCTHSELATRLHVQPATITRMIQRMERAGFVERRPDPEDQRVSRVYLTEAGRAVQGDVQQIWHTLEEETFAGLSPEERALLRRFFVQLRDNLMRVTGGKHPF
jgi:DNA-binding MarR family transcriptional regulator